jgi:putative colanic acid biosynthesis UDP-glucose lipid carrier transferase
MRRVRHMVATGQLRRRVAIFGTLEFITAMKDQIENSEQSVVVEGVYLAKPAAIGSSDLPLDGGLAELKDAIERNEFDTVFIGLPAQDTARIQTAVNGLASYSTELLLCTELDPYPVVVHGSRNFGPLRTNVVNLVPLSESNVLLKSMLDYAVALVGLIVLAPLLAVVALAIKIDSPGPVFFRQRRYGQNNSIFRIFKFRTMAVTEDGPTVKQAERDDPRVTRMGRILRRTSIDELPQLLNVLTGDMSIVGPRPHALAHDQLFEQKLDLFSRRRRVRPGLTGWAQVHGFRGETKTTEDIRSRMQHDLYYIDNWSIWLDIEIITRTVFVLFRGAY